MYIYKYINLYTCLFASKVSPPLLEEDMLKRVDQVRCLTMF